MRSSNLREPAVALPPDWWLAQHRETLRRTPRVRHRLLGVSRPPNKKAAARARAKETV